MRPIKLFADSTSDLSEKLLKHYDIGIVPLYVNFGKESYKDNVDITSPGLFRKVSETGKLPMTSAPSAADFMAAFKGYLEQGMDILHISISSNISSAYQNACQAATQFPEGRVKIIDSLNLSSGIGILVMMAADCIAKKMTLDNVCISVQSAIPLVRTEFIIDKVDYLYKGGRCSGLQMLVSSLLEIHPVIKVDVGAMHVAAKIRGNRQMVLRRLVKDTEDNMDNLSRERIFITHCNSAGDAAWIKTQLIEMNKIKEILVTDASCVISSHCGPGTIGIIYIETSR
jgi:DegV family protein with EDD domain